MPTYTRSSSGLLLPRRAVLHGGLSGLAAAMMSRLLPGCDSPSAMPPGTDAGPLDAGGAIDAGAMLDAGPHEFPFRDIPARPALRSLIADIGPLGMPNADGVRLPDGFTARVLARSGQMVPGTSYTWHRFPDGGATFMTEDGGWIYVSNSEVPIIGGVGAVRFDASGAVRSATRILDRTSANCAGGLTPWHTWLSCEEAANGRVFECDPWGETPPLARPALGVFRHEAVAVDPVRAHLYLTEDEGDGRFYRFVPDRLTMRGHPDLTAGMLEVAVVAMDGSVTWRAVPDPRFTAGTPTRMQVPESTEFDGGEGIWYHEGIVYFSTKGDNRIWAYDAAAMTIRVLYDGDAIADPVLSGVDNVTVSCCGDVLVAEDGGSMEIVAILPGGELKPLMQIVGQDSSEITGPAFDPSGTRLYFSSQRGGEGGITYEVSGPFHAPA